jgi:hypothetical protein
MPTNWVIENFCLVQEEGGNILMEDSDLVSLQEFDSTTWTEQTATGAG